MPSASPAGLTCGSIFFAKLDCRIKSGNDAAASGASVLSESVDGELQVITLYRAKRANSFTTRA